MTYHMSRVMHWFQQGSVAHYPTNILRQLELNPWAEFAILHLQVLSGGDYLANLVQWFSMVGCLIGVSLIARLYMVSMRAQLLSALVAVTVPMAILQSSSTQNDLVVSFWLVCFVFFGLLSIRERSLKWNLLMSFSLGLAILTKGTAYIYAFPFVIWFFAIDVKRSWQQTLLKYLGLAVVILVLNFGHYYRNYQLFKSPLHSGHTPYSNGYVTPRVILSNLSRNIALHMMTPSFKINSYVIGAVNSFHSVLEIGIDEPATTFPDNSFNEKRNRLSPSEDSSGNPLHFILFVAITASIIIRKSLRQYLPYTLTTLACFLLFCTMLRWQPWASRLHTPMFILFSPIAGIVVSEMQFRWSVSVLATVLSFAALPWVLFNQSRPLISLYPLISNFYPHSIFIAPRKSLYFVRSRDSEPSFLATAAKIGIGGYHNIALKGDPEGYEYPLWALTRTNGLDGPNIEYIEVQNESKNVMQSRYNPDVVVVLRYNNDTCEASIDK
jgi:4-amino-4-deoxy-L-arabinose transferase-like glycosyltransferase